VPRSYKFVGQPRWLLGHLVVLAAVITMILLGRWQLEVSNRRHFDLQNSAYSVQWWAFALFALFFWGRIIRDHARRVAGEPEPQAPVQPITYVGYVRPAVEPDRGDTENVAYNDYLARLAGDESERQA
jgi:hypothetical protein